MENIGFGLELMVIGMVTVFLILILIIFMGKLLISFVNRFPEKEMPVQKTRENSAPASVNPTVRNVLEETVRQITNGRGHITNITKL